MAEQLNELKCQRCGGILNVKEDIYVCTCCGKTFEKQVIADVADQLRGVLNEQTQEKTANLKQLLWKEVHEEFVSNREVEKLCKDILKYNPEDFYAKFYLATCSDRRGELSAFLSELDIDEKFDDIPDMLEYLIKGLKDDWTLSVGNLIERAYKAKDIKLYNKYRTLFEAENDKIDDCVYDTSIPRDVFVAYSSADMAYVENLVSALEEEDLTCFVAARNLRHGSGSVENYENALHTAIEHCTLLVFVSSQNSRSNKCDAYKELNYIERNCKSMPRIEYLIKDYTGRAVERYFKSFFSGLEYCTSEEEVVNRVCDKLMGVEDEKPSNVEEEQKTEEEPRAAVEAETEAEGAGGITAESFNGKKICKQCKKANRATAKFCTDCGGREFFTSFEEYLDNVKFKYCVECGERNYKEDKFCAECGSNNFVPTKKEYEKIVEQRQEEESRRKFREEQERKERQLREEQERKERELREEQERKEREQREAQERRERELREERERKEKERLDEEKRKQEARNAILNIGDVKYIGGGYITFGTYPQSKKANDVQIGKLFDNEHGYYLGSDNCLYDKFEGDYYKVEPIKWKVMSDGGEMLIVADNIIEAHCFDNDSNNYADSEIRSWLNSEFYSKAFREGQKTKIVTTSVDNGLSSTGDNSNKYICGRTNDKVFLLSHSEAERYFSSDSARRKTGTDYAKANNLWVSGENGNSWWWLRSPYFKYSVNAQFVFDHGGFYRLDIRSNGGGVLPALKIKVDSDIQKTIAEEKNRQEEQERKERERIAEEKRKQEARNAILNIGDYKDIGDGYITFGTYPQSKKANDVQIGKLFDNEHGYYLGSDNCLYDKFEDDYYKVEPIKWKVMSDSNEMFVVADDIIDAHYFDESSNNYANSEIRSWLNSEFYNKAFRDGQKSKIVTTYVDNSLASTGDKKNKYVCKDTNDKIFLLSYKEAEQYFNGDEARQNVGTYYARARGLFVSLSACYWLRSPYSLYKGNWAQIICFEGDFNGSIVEDYSKGVRPALKIKL